MRWAWERGRATSRASAGAMARVVMLALALTLAGCGLGLSPGASTGAARPQVAGRAKPTPAPALPWRVVAFPAGVTAATAALAISPVNGAETWVCAPSADGGFQIWRSQDEARTWALAFTLAPGAQLASPVCSVSPDQVAADALAVNINWGGGNGVPSPSGSVDYYSADGGASWTQLPADLWLQQVFTAGASVYALAMDLTSPNSTASLIVSDNHFATWRTVATPPEQPTSNDDLWVASDPSAMIWSQMNNNATFTSSDGGATWSLLPTPSAQPFQVTLASWPSGSAGWLLCGYTNVAQPSGAPASLYQCSADLGKTWRTIPGLTNTWACDHCGAGAQSGTEPCLPTAAASDDALLALCGVDTSQDTGPATPAPGLILSRLAPSSSAWATVGQTPCPFSASVTLARTGQLWCQLAATQPPQDYVLERVP